MIKTEAKLSVQQAVDSIGTELINLANRIHDNPETKFEEYEASSWLRQSAEAAGFDTEQPIGELDTAFRASSRCSDGGPTIAFLAEYDALPKLGHGCGHNLIGTASLGAAIAVAKSLGDVPGEVQLIGTPGEEGGGGKVLLAEAGVFDSVDAAMMFHPSARTVLWKYALARRKLKIEFFGKSSHAAGCPEKGRNALDATIQTFNAISALREHTVDSSRIHGIITDGGKAPNIVPDYSSALFYVRAMEDTYCDKLLERVKGCAKGAALATGTEVKLEMQGAYKTLRTNLALAHTFRNNLESIEWKFNDVPPDEGIGSTDMADVSHKVPAIHPYLSIGSKDLAGHSIEFVEASSSEAGHKAMLAAAKAMAMTAVDIMLDSSVLNQIRKEFTSS